MERGRIARAATIIMLGNLVTSGLGFVRQFVTAAYFGSGGRTDAWFAAYAVPQMFYDLLIGGAIAAALIPSFTRLADSSREQYWRVVTTIFVLAAGVLIVMLGLIEVFAQPLMSIASGFQGASKNPATLDTAVKLLRVMLPTLFFWGLSAVALAALYSIGKRVASSFATAAFHTGIIVGVVVLASPMGIVALPIGAVAGSLTQLLIQVPSLIRSRREVGAWVGRRVDFRDPTVRKILVLYAPVAAGICVSIAGQVADLEFKTRLPKGHFSDMVFATTLIQFPVGIIVAALGLAVLPLISSDAAADRMDALKDKLALGFRLVIVLMVPAAVGYEVVGQQIVSLVFEHHLFTAGDANTTFTALRWYAPQLPFVGIDQLLIFSFYARQNTVTPMLVGILGVSLYVAIGLFVAVGPGLSVTGLAIANTAQIGVHAMVLLYLLVRQTGWLGARGLKSTIFKVGVASAFMGIITYPIGHVIEATASTAPLVERVEGAFIPILAAACCYVVLSLILGVDEMRWIWRLAAVRLGRLPGG
jgi:putative peptidoglycan lipid II flippase